MSRLRAGTGRAAEQTGYDNILQAMSGLMAMTGTPEVAPLKRRRSRSWTTPPAPWGAFAIATALFHRERTGPRPAHRLGDARCRADPQLGSHIAAHGWNGAHPEPHGNSFPFATIGCYQAADAPLMVSASNLRQQLPARSGPWGGQTW